MDEDDKHIEDDEPDETEYQVWDLYAQVATDICRKLLQVPHVDGVGKCLDQLRAGVINSVNSLEILVRHAPHDFLFDASSILRTVYDVHLQILYSLQDPNRRAKQYFDFMDVQKFRMLKLLESNGTDVAKIVLADPSMSSVRLAVAQAHSVAAKIYSTKDGKSVHKDWHCRKLDEIAKAVGYGDEYALMQFQFGGATHSAPLSIYCGPPVRKRSVLSLGWRFTLRLLEGIAKFHSLELGDIEKRVFDINRSDLYCNSSVPEQQ